MSFIYLIATPKKIDFLKQNRFQQLLCKENIYIYGMPFEGLKWFTDRSQETISITDKGMNFFRNLSDLINEPFYFSYVLLKNREGELDFAEYMFNYISNNTNCFNMIDHQSIIQLREIYCVK